MLRLVKIGVATVLWAMFIFFFCPMETAAQTDSLQSKPALFQYLPELSGTLRVRSETEFAHDGLPAATRFQIRNARLALRGGFGDALDYFLNTDLCDQGKFKFLDGWVRVNTPGHLSLRMGQFRMPFGVDNFMAPENYIFSNRSFIGKQMCNVRAVGASLAFRPKALPVFVEGGLFNPTPIGDHMIWTSKLAYAAKLTYRLGHTTLATGFQSIRPDRVRINLTDATLTWTPDRHWTVAAEYMFKHYTHRAFKAAHSWLAWAQYRMPAKAWVFNQLSFQGRYDGMTAHSDGHCNAEGLLQATHPARNRITVGSTISYIRSKKMYLYVRADYEKYFYHHGQAVATGDSDRFLLELILHFSTSPK